MNCHGQGQLTLASSQFESSQVNVKKQQQKT